MTKREWRAFIARTRQQAMDLSDLCWAAGDMLLENIPAGMAEGKVYEMLRRWKEETGCSFTVRSLVAFRTCSHTWPPTERVYNCPWIVYWSLHLDKELIHDNMTIQEAQEVSPLAKATV